jgi:hypothetical protein
MIILTILIIRPRLLPAGTAGTDRVHPRRAAGRAGMGTEGRRVRRTRVDKFFFSKLYPTRFIPVPVADTRIQRARVLGHGHGFCNEESEGGFCNEEGRRRSHQP